MKEAWKYWGKLNSRKAVYVQKNGRVGVEEDFLYLVAATPEEKQEIDCLWPGLRDRRGEREDRFPAIDNNAIGGLMAEIKGLKYRARERENVIAALKDANKAKDEINDSLMKDIEELEERRGEEEESPYILRGEELLDAESQRKAGR